MESMGNAAPRSTSHQGLVEFSSVWVWPPSPNLPLVLPSMALPASPPEAVLLWLALPSRATFRPWLYTSTSASVSVFFLPGSSMRT